MNPVLKVCDLHFSYGVKDVLKGVHLTLNQGEVLCLLGPNGCGKTTLLDCILNFLTPREGTVFLGNEDSRRLSSARISRAVAYVPQHHTSHFPFTVTDFVLMGRTPHLGIWGTPGASDRQLAREILVDLGLESLMDADYSLLSGGETRMVLIARALVQDAPVLIMDEPGSHLDFRNEYLMLERVIHLVKERGRSVLMTTHSPNQVYFMESCGAPVRAAVLHGGTIMQTGSPSETMNPRVMKDIYGVDTALVTRTHETGCYSSIIPIPGCCREVR